VGLRVAFHQAKQAKLASEAIAGTLARMFRLLFLALALGLVACDSRRPDSAPTRELGLETRFPVRMGVVLSQLRVAISDLEKARGLMGVDKLEEAEGMAFLYDEDGQMSFWMKNTLIDPRHRLRRPGRHGPGGAHHDGGSIPRPPFRSPSRRVSRSRCARGGSATSASMPGDKVNLEDLRAAVRARGYDVKKFLP